MKHNPVLTLTQDGTPHAWMTWEDSVTLICKDLVAWSLSDESIIYGGMSRMTGERSHVEVPSIIAVKGNFKHKRSTPALNNTTLFKRDLLTCGFCGKHFSEANLTRDHIVPVSKGGKDVWSNVITACKRCNGLKGNKLIHETNLELLWVPYVPDRAEHLLLQNRKILYDQAKYIADFIPKHSRAPQYLKEHCGIDLT